MTFQFDNAEVIGGATVLVAAYALAMAVWLIRRRRRNRPADLNPRSRQR